MSAVLEFGFDAAPAFSGVDRLEQKLNGLNGTVARVSTAHDKLRQAMKNPWVSAGIDAQAYLEKMRAVERQDRSIAAAHQRLAAAGSRTSQIFAPKAANPWTTAGAGQYAAQQEVAAAAAAQQRAAEAAAGAQQKAAAAAAADAVRQQRAAEAAAAAQQRSAALASAAAAAGARQAAQEAVAQRNRAQSMIDGRLELHLIEARLAGNAKETKQFEHRIAQLAQMRQLQSQLGLSQRDAYMLSSRMAANPRTAGMAGGGGGGGRGSFALGQAAYQVQDIAVQLQMGTRYSTILAQQGSQLLSVFGTGGAIAGGAIAIGGAFLQMADNAKQAFAEAAKGQKEFEQEVAKTIATSNGAELFNSTEKAQERLKGLREEFDKIANKRGAGDVIAEWFGGPSFDEKYLAAADRIAATEKIIQGELSKALLESSQQDTQVVLLRTSGREAEANAMERQLKFAREISRLDSLNVPDDVKAQLKGDAKTNFDAVNAAESAKEVQKIAEAQSQLDEQKHKAGLDQMTLAKRIATLGLDVKKAAESEARLRSSAAPDEQKLIAAESRRVTLQTELLNLQKQMTKEKEREAEEAKRSAEQAQREAEAAAKRNSDRRNSVLDTAMEYKILQAKARGNEHAVEEAEREQRILERAAKFEAQNGLNKQQALALAIKMADLEDRANGKGGHIHGVADNSDPNQRNGLSKPWQSGPSGNGTYRGLGGGSDPLSKNGGLAGFWDLQAGNIGSRTGMSDAYLQNTFSDGQSIREHHAANAEAQAGAGNAGDNRLVDAFLDKLIGRLPPALANAILEKSS